MYQPTLQAAQEPASEVIATACHDYTYLQGEEGAVVAGARRIMSHHACQPHDVLVFCVKSKKAPNGAAALRATVETGEIAACGTLLGHTSFVGEYV